MTGWSIPSHDDGRRLLICGVLAVLIEMITLFVVGFQGHWLAHPSTDLDESRFIEAQVFEIPKEAHLVEEKPKAAPVSHAEPTLSKIPQKGVASKDQRKIEEENQTDSGPKLTATHGPLAIFAPAPVIPSYLRDKDLKASVVIDFYVNAQGVATPRLAGSSGNEELDAIAIQTAKKWQFRPAEQDHKPVDAKVRLRIVFEVQ
jgi:TonB family protein